MAEKSAIARAQWERYQYMRDYGHQDFLVKADRCEDFFAGLQWSPEDLETLRAVRRPALTINKIISTISTILGEQIYNRSEIAFAPRANAAPGVAEALTRLFMQIADNNQLQWLRSDVFADGIIRGRGFYDVRLDFNDQTMGEVKITPANSKNVLIDPDAEGYDPDEWKDVIYTKWLSPDDVEYLYGKEFAEEFRARQASVYNYGFDSLELRRERFAGRNNQYGHYSIDVTDQDRYIRVLDRQYRKLDTVRHFVDPKTGDTRQIPDGWNRDKIAAVKAKYGLEVIKKPVLRVRWTVTAEDQVLHDDWSPFKHFTLVPYFPYFRYGRTIGLVENLLGPQELLNKASSQELHVINTTANSGWKVKVGSLKNMTTEELEARGAQTGIVLELDDIGNADKIQPNQIPSGLDRITFKAEESIKSISNVSDSMQGFDREDVAAKAILAKQQRGSVNFTKITDNLNRTDYILARNVLDIVQEYYTEPRILNVTRNSFTQERDELQLNQVSPEGEIVNDLTMGEYDVVVVAQPERDLFEDTQFEQAKAMREIGIPIPDKVLIENSRLARKQELVRELESDQNSPEAQAQADLKRRAQEAAVRKAEAEALEVETKARLNAANAEKAIAQAQTEGMDDAAGRVDAEMQLKKHEIDQKMDLARYETEERMKLEREKAAAEMELKRSESKHKQRMERASAAMKAAQAPDEAPTVQ